MSLDIVNPVPPLAGDPVPAPQRPATLEGQRLGVLINGKEYSEQVLRRVTANLTEQVDVAEVVWWNKRFPAVPCPFVEEMADRIDLVINGVGH